jgi:hypothetical protein
MKNLIDMAREAGLYGAMTERISWESFIEAFATLVRDDERKQQDHIANVGKLMPNLWPVINWLENGCDPKEAAKELRIYESQRQNHPGESADMVQEPVAIGAYEVVNEAGNEWSLVYPQAVHKYKMIPENRITQTFYTAPPTAPNLNCKSVQRRLATSWGYVRKEEYDMARVAAATAMRDAAVRVCREMAHPVGAGMMSDFQWAANGCAEAITALPIPGEER